MDLSYPIGRFQAPETVSPEMRSEFIATIGEAPAGYRNAVQGLDEAQLDTPYRPGGWTVRQVVHHVADSHMNSFIRLRLALTEDCPTIKPYDQDAWSQLADSKTLPAEVSLQLLESLHRRMVAVLVTLSDAEFARTFRHPEVGTLRLDTYLALYAWHCGHHLAHITGLRQRMHW